MSSALKALSQQRADHAWRTVERLVQAKKSGDLSVEACRELKRLPVRIMTSGLGPALAFLNAKGKKGTPLFAGALSQWVGGRCQVQGDLLESFRKKDASFLRLATAESLAYLEWLVRFAEAEDLLDKEG